MPAQTTTARRWALLATSAAAAATLVAGLPSAASATEHRSDHRGTSHGCHDRDRHDPVMIREAIDIAEHKVHGMAVEAELDEVKLNHNDKNDKNDKNERIVWEVEVMRHHGATYDVLIDPRTGCVLKVEKEKEEEEA